MFQLVASLFDALSYIPDILRESGNLFGIFALIAMIMAVIALLFFKNSGTTQKERIFVYTTLFLLSLVFASLFAGLSTGFQSGKEVAVTDPALVELSPDATQALEDYLRTSGSSITDQNRSEILSDALTNYISQQASSTTASTSESATANSAARSELSLPPSVGESVPDGFRIDPKDCSQIGGTISCDLLITNTTEDVSVTLFADGTYSDSRLVDGDGNQYIVSTLKVGDTENGNSQTVAFARDVPVRITLITSNAVPSVSKISLIELLGSTKNMFSRSDMTFQVRDVQITQ